MERVKIETIFDLLRNKETQGFELLNKYYFRTIYGVAFSITKNEDKSNDTVQNVFLRLFRLDYEKFPSGNELSWLYKVTKNEALQILRKEKKILEVGEVTDLPCSSTSIDEFISMDNYYSMIESLGDNAKEVVTLKVLGDMTHKEIAQVLGKPIGTIQWIYNTSIRKLRNIFAALASISIFAGAALFRRYMVLIQNQGGVPEMEGPVEPTQINFFGDTFFLIYLVITILGVIGFIVFLKKSEKIPTKAQR